MCDNFSHVDKEKITFERAFQTFEKMKRTSECI